MSKQTSGTYDGRLSSSSRCGSHRRGDCQSDVIYYWKLITVLNAVAIFLFATLKSFQRDSASKSAIATIEPLTVTSSSTWRPPRHPDARRHFRRFTARRPDTRSGKDSVRLQKQLIQKCTVKNRLEEWEGRGGERELKPTSTPANQWYFFSFCAEHRRPAGRHQQHPAFSRPTKPTGPTPFNPLHIKTIGNPKSI